MLPQRVYAKIDLDAICQNIKNAMDKVGKIASTVFFSRGYMSHDLNAPIPGATEIPQQGNEKEAMDRLYKAIKDFKNFSGELKIHFAYGELSKSDYEKAHVMHIANHLSFVNVEK